jgi:hypothetical protein
MTTLTGRGTRTITGYVYTLLELPRMVIERDVDFTNCRHRGVWDASAPECIDCHFGDACRWLNQHRTPRLDSAALDELVHALDAAVRYIQSQTRHKKHCSCDTCKWLIEARAFLRHRPDAK